MIEPVKESSAPYCGKTLKPVVKKSEAMARLPNSECNYSVLITETDTAPRDPNEEIASLRTLQRNESYSFNLPQSFQVNEL